MRIEIKSLIHKYPSGDIALNGLNTIFEGIEPIAIIGQNGAGKTTFVKHLNGLLRPTGLEKSVMSFKTQIINCFWKV